MAKVSPDIVSIDKVFNLIDEFLEKDVRIEVINREMRIV